MERRQIVGTIGAAGTTAGAAAVYASLNGSIEVAAKPWLLFLGAAALVTGLGVLLTLLVTARPKLSHAEPATPAQPPPSVNFVISQGGAGGSPTAGPGGIAIGGPGGHSGGLAGRGGDGGGAGSIGDIVVGGGGGSVDGHNVWYPPAPSGYEVYMRAKGEKPDPAMKPFGRGGMSAGYAEKFSQVLELRAAYFMRHGIAAKSVDEDIDAMPLGLLNEELANTGKNWRARVADERYIFFIPEES